MIFLYNSLLLLGKTGAGKSATGNLILGKSEFVESIQSTSCTKTIKLAECDVDGIHIKVIDTPGFNDTGANPDDILTEMAKVSNYYRNGIHGVLFVFSLGNPRFTEEEKQSFNLIYQGDLGKDLIDRCFVVFSHGSEIVKQGSLQNYLRNKSERGSDFGHLLNVTVNKRVIAVENAEPTEYGRQLQREQLVRMVTAHSTRPCTPDVFEEFIEKQRQVVKKTLEPYRPYIEEIERKVADENINMPHERIAKLSDQDKRDIISRVAALVNKMIARERAEVEGVVRPVVEGHIDRVTYRGNRSGIFKFAGTLLTAAGMASMGNLGGAFQLVAGEVVSWFTK